LAQLHILFIRYGVVGYKTLKNPENKLENLITLMSKCTYPLTVDLAAFTRASLFCVPNPGSIPVDTARSLCLDPQTNTAWQIGNFGTVFVDQSYWQGAIAARPSATYKVFALSASQVPCKYTVL
jgi:hypothetical protein